MSGLDGSSIKQKSQCAAGLPGRSHLPECRSEACVERWVHDIFHLFIIVPVAQPDRVSDSDSEHHPEIMQGLCKKLNMYP